MAMGNITRRQLVSSVGLVWLLNNQLSVCQLGPAEGLGGRSIEEPTLKICVTSYVYSLGVIAMGSQKFYVTLVQMWFSVFF